ncbi:acetolactate synthase small subunit [Alicyclobacillaceae bacterium I2511]|nr:acetolactate synthase small subunit [Alicyclobacillaceae bacterium I2511]
MNRIVSVIVNNKPGVLNRVTAMFMRRGFNIQSITVGATEAEGQSRMTIVVADMDEPDIEQMMKQLHKQIDVLKVTEVTEQPMVARELALIRVHSPVPTRGVLSTLIDPFRATIIDVGVETVTIQSVGKPEKVDALIALLRPYGIKELARTGVTALSRDSDTVGEVARLQANTLSL